MPLVFVGILILILIAVPKSVSNMDEFLPKVKQYAAEYGLSWAYLAGIIQTESAWKADAYREEPRLSQVQTPSGRVLNDGSYGLGQILYSVAQGLGFSGEPEELLDPDTNLHYSALLNRNNFHYWGNYPDAASAYNSGKPLASAPDSTVNLYVPKVISIAQKLDPTFTA